ncbi:TonB-dependent receptor plug domain-containing protein [Flavobacterium sp. CF136]|uniref:TonB-dependent receptor plug domain-containing protein n=1 Tax=Flavobacterium sp. (strain CF136) TaxID=1144313 RepID=UPI00027196EF|nr:TonB-dependent receptor plug domain-containing protein [Flavobacterium sp. CF136]EJL61510.1 TonB-dependent receptor family protein [Flavobacterium sp. CF136]
MKSLKLISSAFTMLICFVVSAQEKTNISTSEDKIPPIEVSSNFAKTDASPSFRIVCAKTVSDKDEPLYILDGIPIKAKQFAEINPNDIENIKVLKNSNEAAICGGFGRKGVVIITTKKRDL